MYTTYAVYMGLFINIEGGKQISPLMTGQLPANGPAELGRLNSPLHFSSASSLAFNPLANGAAIYDDTTPFAPMAILAAVTNADFFDSSKSKTLFLYHSGAATSNFYTLELVITTEYQVDDTDTSDQNPGHFKNSAFREQDLLSAAAVGFMFL